MDMQLYKIYQSEPMLIQASIKKIKVSGSWLCFAFVLQKRGRGKGQMLVSLSALSNVSFEVWLFDKNGQRQKVERLSGSWSVNDSSYPVLSFPADLGGD